MGLKVNKFEKIFDEWLLPYKEIINFDILPESILYAIKLKFITDNIQNDAIKFNHNNDVHWAEIKFNKHIVKIADDTAEKVLITAVNRFIALYNHIY